MAKTFICDVMPGGGKSSAVIKMMNEATDKRFIYIAPYKDEDDRIVAACKSRGFVTPQPKNENGKLDNLHHLLRSGLNVASTHALFERYTPETIELIRDGNYCLVMDEAFQIAKILDYTEGDIKVLVTAGLIDVSTKKVRWIGDDYSSGVFSDLKDYAQSGHLQSFKNMFFYWYYPPDVFSAFQEAYVLTYMFDAQFLKHYFDIHEIEYTNIWVEKIEGEYVFVDYPVVPDHAKTLKDKIHILDHPRMNSIGDNRTSLSATWFKGVGRKRVDDISQLKRNIGNFFRNIAKKNADDLFWTTYKSGQERLEGRGYMDEFVPYNARATNMYREKDALAYCVNVFPNPNYVAFFSSYGRTFDGDGYALSEMIQLIWRSAIREGKEIWVYIPSKRMRTLLENWLDELASETSSNWKE